MLKEMALKRRDPVTKTDDDSQLSLSLDAQGITPFQRKVYVLVSQIPAGRVMTYLGLARAVGCRSCQAVGQALKRNPFAPAVPCHRVISSDYTIGGFAGNRVGDMITRKLALLAEEGVLFENGRLKDPTRVLVLPYMGTSGR